MGVKDYFDILSFHPYSLSKENVDNAVYKVKAMRLVLAQYGRDDVPIWFTEIGWTTSDAPLVDKERRAELLTMLYKFPFHKAVEKIFWFPFDTWSSSLPPDFSGLVHVFNGQIYKSPSFEAYCEIAEKE
jgi:hypothetical protein